MKNGQLVSETASPRKIRRELIISAAVSLFGERGFAAVSIDDIGAAAGITGPGIYRHFGSKQGVLVAAFERAWDRMSSELAAALSAQDDPREQLAAVIDSYAGIALDNRELINVYLHESNSLPAEEVPRVRSIQSLYVEEWGKLLRSVRPALSASEARIAAQAAIGLINSGALPVSRLARSRRRQLLATMASRALELI